MSKGLSIDYYTDYILLQLGSSVVNIEIEKDIPSVVNMAFQELKHYITDVETLTLPYSNIIDLKDKGISSIVYIMRGSKNSGGTGGYQDVMYVYSRRNTDIGRSGYGISDYARSLMINQNKSALSTDMDFNHDKKNDKLYIYAQQSLPENVTLVYIPEYENVEDIIEPFWQNLLKRLALAMTKEILGRIRGKYKLNSATYDLDADQLLSEAQIELDDIRMYLNSNSDIVLPID